MYSQNSYYGIEANKIIFQGAWYYACFEILSYLAPMFGASSVSFHVYGDESASSATLSLFHWAWAPFLFISESEASFIPPLFSALATPR